MEAVPDVYVCPLCSAGRQPGSRRGGGGVSRQDRERATELQRLRKEVEARLRRQRVAAGLLSSSSAGGLEGIPLPASDQDEEDDLLAQARGLAYQKSLTLGLPISSDYGKGINREAAGPGPGGRRPKSHSPAGYGILQPAASVSEKHNILTGGTGAGTNVPTTLLPSLSPATSANNTGAVKQKRKSGGFPPAITSNEEDEGRGPQDSPGMASSGAGGSRRRKSGATALSNGSHPLKDREAAEHNIGQSEAELSRAATTSGNLEYANTVSGPASTNGINAGQQSRHTRARLSTSIPNSAAGPNGSIGNSGPTSVPGAGTTDGPRSGGGGPATFDDRDAFLSDDNLDLSDERYEPWNFEYTPISKSRWLDRQLEKKVGKIVQVYLQEERENLGSAIEQNGISGTNPQKDAGKDSLGVPYQPHPTIKSGPATIARSVRPTLLGSTSFLNNIATVRNASPVPSSGSSTPAYSSSGVACALSNPMSPAILSSPLKNMIFPKLSVKPLATSSLSLAPPACTPFSGPTCIPSLMNPYPRPTIHGVFSTTSYSSGHLVSIMYGEVLSGEQYRASPVNQWSDTGVMKNHTRSVGQPWDLVLDQRRWGDESRFLRQGCHPNVYVRPIIARKTETAESTGPTSRTALLQTGKKGRKQRRLQRQYEASSIDDEWELAFGLYALQDIHKREELVLPFDWADDHVVHTLHTLLFSPQLIFPSIPSNLHSGDTDDSSDDGIPSTSSFPVLSQTQKNQIKTATKHLYRLSRLSSTTCLTLLGTTICACERRRDCAVAWLWKLASFSESSNRNWTGTIRLQDFDLNGLKVACSAALATAEKGTGYQNRSHKKTGRKRRADLGALVGLSRGWLKQPSSQSVSALSQQHFTQQEDVEDDETNEKDMQIDYQGELQSFLHAHNLDGY